MTRSLIIVILTAGLSFGLAGGVMAGWHRQQAPGGNPEDSSDPAGRR